MPRTRNTAPPPPEPRTLFPHQLEAAELMKLAEERGFVPASIPGFTIESSCGVLKNPVGSGKTSVVLKLIRDNARPIDKIDKVVLVKNYNRGISSGDPRPLYPSRFYPIPASLVVCPKPLIPHWREEARIMGVPIVEFSVPSSLSGEKFEKNVKLIEEGCVGRGAFVILVSMHIFPLFIRPLRKYIYRNDLQKENQFIFFNRIIFDDFHSGEKAFNAHYNGKVSGGFLWFINSTPELIQISRLNSLHYMSSLCPGSSIDNSYHVVNVPVPESTYVLPECVVRTILYRDSTAVARLGEGFPREVVECMEMGDFNGAYNLMAGVPLGTTIPPENRIPIHQLAMARYSNLLDQLRDRQAKLIELGHSTENVEQQIEKTEREMEVLQERIKGFASENIECPICLSETEPQSRVIVKCCSNIFCGECMGKTIRLNGRCPMCREKVGLGSIYSMDENGNVIDLNDYQRNRGKGVGGESSEPRSPMEALENLLRENPEGKFVVFAKNESSSSGYKRYFNTESRILEDVTGSVTKIQNTLREFREGGLRVLFLSSKTSNAGLNLQFATDVVIIGSSLTNEGDINQSLGRVRRFPRREPVPVHYIKRI